MNLAFTWLLGLFRSPTSLLLSLVNQHKGIRRGLVIWAAMQVGWVIHRVFDHMDQISGFAVSAMTVVVAPLVGLIVFYVKTRTDAESGDDDSTNKTEGKDNAV